MHTEILLIVCVFSALLGLLIGSFLNVVIYRIPNELSVNEPKRSFCPKCEAPIAARDNIPVLSWLLLHGKCRSCAEPISKRYPLIEALTGVLFAALGGWGYDHVNVWFVPCLWAFAAFAVALAFIDLDTMRLPSVLLWPMYPVVLGLGSLALLGGHHPLSWVHALYGTAVWGGLIWVCWFGGKVLNKPAMGFGDVQLAPLLGFLLGLFGWGPVVVGLFFTFVFGAVVGIGLIASGKAGRKSRVPFGPYLLAGAVFGLLAGAPVWSQYLSIINPT